MISEEDLQKGFKKMDLDNSGRISKRVNIPFLPLNIRPDQKLVPLPKKKMLTECIWNHGAPAQSAVAGTSTYW